MVSLKTLEEKLQAALTPSHLEIVNESSQHAGHAGATNDLSHLLVKIQSPLFANKSKVACHQMVYAVLETEMRDVIHALRIEIMS